MGQSFFYFRLPAVASLLFGRSCVSTVLSVTLCVLLCADSSTKLFSQPPSTVNSGIRYVLLDNDHVLAGTVFRRGPSVIVRRGNEAELTLRATQVVAVADDLPQLYQARIRAQHRRSAPNLVERIGDARWCIDNALPAHATAALMKVYALAPNHPVAIQLERRLRNLLEESDAPPAAVAQVSTAQFIDDGTGEGAIQSVGHTDTVATRDPGTIQPETVVHVSAAPASLHEFTAKVQPILLARCSQCHHERSTVSTNWNLSLPPGGSTRVTQPGSLANLNATLPFCNSTDPQTSQLIRKAIAAHGEMPPNRPAIDEHEAALATTLMRWIATLDAPSQQPTELDQIARTIEPASLTMGEATNFPPLNPINPVDLASSLNSPQSGPTLPESPTDQSAGPSPLEQGRPTRLPTIDNPNDVEQFNRQTRLRRRLGLR